MSASISSLSNKLKNWFRQRIAYTLLAQAEKDEPTRRNLANIVLDSASQDAYFGDQLIHSLTEQVLAGPARQDVDHAFLEHFANNGNLEEFAPILARIASRYLEASLYEKYFQFWEKHGFHLTPNHFYSPLPDTRTLTDDFWERESEMIGVDMNTATQLHFLTNVFPNYRDEYNQFTRQPTGCEYEFYFDNGLFSGADALVLYCMVRHFKPKLIMEVGSGFSTRVSAQAAIRNGGTRLISIEPYPPDILRRGFPGLNSLIEKPVQEVGLAPFLELTAGDILFIDTSHVSKSNGEVNFLFLEVLPRLNPGVVIHIHDIFLPREYPKEWIIKAKLFSNEQYLVQAFLSFNRDFEILFGIAHMDLKYPQIMKDVFPNAPFAGNSLWIQRKS